MSKQHTYSINFNDRFLLCVLFVIALMLQPSMQIKTNQKYGSNPISICWRTKHICTGQIISHRAVLTAATCLQHSDGHARSVSLLSIVVVLMHTTKYNETEDAISVYRVAKHSRQDLALLIVRSETFKLSTATIPMSFFHVTANDENTECLIARPSNCCEAKQQQQQRQNVVSVNVIDSFDCRRIYEQIGVAVPVADWICVVAVGGECSAYVDGGSALICNGQLVGIAMQRYRQWPNKNDFPILYTSVSISRHWILYQQQGTASNFVRQVFVNIFLLILNRILCS